MEFLISLYECSGTMKFRSCGTHLVLSMRLQAEFERSLNREIHLQHIASCPCHFISFHFVPSPSIFVSWFDAHVVPSFHSFFSFLPMFSFLLFSISCFLWHTISPSFNFSFLSSIFVFFLSVLNCTAYLHFPVFQSSSLLEYLLKLSRAFFYFY